MPAELTTTAMEAYRQDLVESGVVIRTEALVKMGKTVITVRGAALRRRSIRRQSRNAARAEPLRGPKRNRTKGCPVGAAQAKPLAAEMNRQTRSVAVACKKSQLARGSGT